MTTNETMRILAVAGALFAAGTTRASDVTSDRQAVTQAAKQDAIKKADTSSKANAGTKVCTCPTPVSG